MHVSPSHLLNINFNIILSSTARSSEWSLSFGPPTKTVHGSLLSLLRATRHAALILLILCLYSVPLFSPNLMYTRYIQSKPH